MKRCFCCCCVYCWCSSCYFCCCCSWSQKPKFNVWLKLGQKQMIYWWLMPLSLCWLWCKIIFMSNLTFVMLFELSWCWMVDNYLVATTQRSLNKLLQIVQWKVIKRPFPIKTLFFSGGGDTSYISRPNVPLWQLGLQAGAELSQTWTWTWPLFYLLQDLY